MIYYSDTRNWISMQYQDRVSSLLASGYECLKNADLGSASKAFDQAMHDDFDNPEVLFAMKCAQFWNGILKELGGLETALGKGDRIVARWKSFQDFLSRIPGDFEKALYAFKRLAFGLALDFYLSVPDEVKTSLGAEFDFRLGRCRKALGDYETALQHLERAAKFKKDDARYMAELADCQALSGEQRISKTLFREAFFIAPDKIDLELLESDMIRKLIQRTEESRKELKELAEWIPVYGELSGLFGLPRELTPSERSRLTSSMFQLENDIRENPSLEQSLKPRLLNRYFWLLRHYEATGTEQAKLEKTLQKIRLLDENIFKQYES